MKLKFGLSILFAVPLGACASIDQVPLVYVSTVKVGINAATGTAESPGGKIMLGVEATDAAYVPVAITRRCDVSADNQCKIDDYPILHIRGDNQVTEAELFSLAQERSRSLESASQNLKTAQGALNAAVTEEEAASERAKMFASYEASVKAFDEANAIAVKSGNPVVTETADITAFRAWLQTNKDAEQQLGIARKKRAEAAVAVQTATAASETAGQNLAAIVAQTPGTGQGLKTDALSVYGTFNSNSGVESGTTGPGGKLNLGKSFSTGVAAQLLAEGLKEAAIPGDSQAACLGRAQDAAKPFKDADKKEVLLAAIKACGSSANP